MDLILFKNTFQLPILHSPSREGITIQLDFQIFEDTEVQEGVQGHAAGRREVTEEPKRFEAYGPHPASVHACAAEPAPSQTLESSRFTGKHYEVPTSRSRSVRGKHRSQI